LGENGLGTSTGDSGEMVRLQKETRNINQEMKDINLLEFVSPKDFVDLHDIVKQHAEKTRHVQ
jgi:hypothetical protein